jgi:hypothetical protein
LELFLFEMQMYIEGVASSNLTFITCEMNILHYVSKLLRDTDTRAWPHNRMSIYGKKIGV